MQITSLQNPTIKAAVKLQNRRERDETGLFLIEGYRELSRALKGGVQIEKIFFCPQLFLGENEDALIKACKATAYNCTEPVFRKMSYRDRPDGLIAVARQMRCTLGDLPQKKDPLYVIAEAIEKPGNLGSIMRSADGVGADGVIVCDRCTDIYNPNVVRASVGTLFTLPVVEAERGEILRWLKENQVRVVATSPAATSTYTETDLTGPIAVVVGTEQIGLTERWLEEADCKVSIPMQGVADSLNVATATTLILYEVFRQRAHAPLLR
jgi:TrmH family RNA methyltransferase